MICSAGVWLFKADLSERKRDLEEQQLVDADSTAGMKEQISNALMTAVLLAAGFSLLLLK